VRIVPLSAHPEHSSTLAAWHHAEWGHLYGDWTLATATAELADHASRRALPTTLLLVDGQVPAGSVSLVPEDAPELSEYGGPWLASLYVRPEVRGQGWGAQLAVAAVHLAAEQGVSRLLLFTPAHALFYRRLGWRAIERIPLRGTLVDVMEIAPSIGVDA
jgi:GNAT superfamily N-acetyltransferase